MSSITFGTYTPKEEKTIGSGPDLVVGIFFDGTGNNRKNARAYPSVRVQSVSRTYFLNCRKHEIFI